METIFFDTHTHFPDESSAEEREVLWREACQAGVPHLLLAGTSLEDVPRYLEFAGVHPGIYTSVGIHPECCGKFSGSSEQLALLRRWCGMPGVVAIGEVGMDTHYAHTTLEQQEECLRGMLSLAVELSLPVVLHCREAFRQCFPIVSEMLPESHPLQVHSFADGPREMEQWLTRNAFFSYNGMVTFKKAENIRETLRMTPLDRLLLETDSPYLTPVPYRGTPNASRNIPLIARRVAEERGLSLEEVAEITTRNARRLFRL